MRLYVSCLLFALVTVLLTPISAEAQLTDVDCVAIVDSVGTRVARTINDNFSTQFFYKVHNGFAVPLWLFDNAINGAATRIWFTDANCSSTPFVAPEVGVPPIYPISLVIDQDVYYSEPPPAVLQNIQALSFRSTGNVSCQPTNMSVYAAPAIGQFTLPQYTPPFHIESEACFTPSPAVAALTTRRLLSMALLPAFGAYVLGKRRFATLESD